MGARIMACNGLIPALADQLSLEHHDPANRHLAGSSGLGSELERPRHPSLIVVCGIQRGKLLSDHSRSIVNEPLFLTKIRCSGSAIYTDRGQITGALYGLTICSCRMTPLSLAY